MQEKICSICHISFIEVGRQNKRITCSRKCAGQHKAKLFKGNSWGFKKGHLVNQGRVQTEVSRLKISKSVHQQYQNGTRQRTFGKAHLKWSGDFVSYSALHAWIRVNKPKSLLCELCKKQPPHDAANISGTYKRDINDFEWLCRRCHMLKDGRLEKNRERGFKKYKHKI